MILELSLISKSGIKNSKLKKPADAEIMAREYLRQEHVHTTVECYTGRHGDRTDLWPVLFLRARDAVEGCAPARPCIEGGREAVPPPALTVCFPRVLRCDEIQRDVVSQIPTDK